MTKRKRESNTINIKNLFDDCSSILISFLSKFSPSFDKRLTAAMTNSFTHLQLSLGILVHDKKLVEHLQEYGLTSTYHEVRRYKISAAVASDEKGEKLLSSDGLVQVIPDNFDAHIHLQIGL